MQSGLHNFLCNPASYLVSERCCRQNLLSEASRFLTKWLTLWMEQIHSETRYQPSSSSEALHSSAYSVRQSEELSSQLHRNMQVKILNIRTAAGPEWGQIMRAHWVGNWTKQHSQNQSLSLRWNCLGEMSPASLFPAPYKVPVFNRFSPSHLNCSIPTLDVRHRQERAHVCSFRILHSRCITHTCNQKKSFCFSFFQGSFPMFFINTAVQSLAGLIDHCLLQIYVIIELLVVKAQEELINHHYQPYLNFNSI